MAKKQTEEQAELTAGLEARHNELQAKRRELEVELSAIDGKLREAIDNGDLAALDSLTSRKRELPKLFIAASTAETSARRDMFNAEDEANLKLLTTAEAERSKLEAAFQERQREIEAEFAKTRTEIAEARARVMAAYSTIQSSRDLGASGDAGFKRSLATIES